MEQKLARNTARILFAAAVAATTAGITACGSGGSSPAPAPAPAPPVCRPDRRRSRALFDAGDFRPDRSRNRASAVDRLFSVARRTIRAAGNSPSAIRAGELHSRSQHCQLQLHAGLVLAAGDSRARSAATAREVRAVGTGRRIRRRQHDRRVLRRPCELRRSARAARVRQLPAVDRGGGHEPDDGHLSVAPREQEGRPGHRRGTR